MMKFYEQLCSMPTPPVIDRSILANKISSMEPDIQAYIFVIITHYTTIKQITDISAVNMGTRGIKFNANLLPEDLCIILYQFTTLVT